MKKSIITFAVALATLAVNANTLEQPAVVSLSNGTESIVKSPLNSFCKAIVMGKTDVVKQMISLGEDVNEKCLGKTPAMYAARYNKPEILQLLIESGAKLNTRSDEEKYTAKQFAELSNATEALEIIKTSDK